MTMMVARDAEPVPVFSGERAVWHAVLTQAMNDAQPSTLCTSQQRASAQAWFCSEAEHVGSFRFVCGVLGVEADAVRDELVRMLNPTALQSNFQVSR